jgi:hypothetical protein
VGRWCGGEVVCASACIVNTLYANTLMADVRVTLMRTTPKSLFKET